MRVALVMRGEPDDPTSHDAVTTRFADLVDALRSAGHTVHPVVYNETHTEQVRSRLLDVDLVLVWVNPIDAGRDRSELDALLHDVADAGVTVSSHPDVVLALGTKRVLYDTRTIGWSSPSTRLYETPDELVAGLAETLATGQRVLKQHRGSSGNGVWSVERLSGKGSGQTAELRVRHAKRGSADEIITYRDFCARLAPFLDAGPIIDQQFQDRLAEGMIRCYLVRDEVAGFGHQATNALIPAAPGASAPTPTQRFYFPPTNPEFQRLKHRLETEWVPAVRQLFGLSTDQLPLLWDCDFLLGPVDASGADTYRLCEINVSSVHPYPSSIVPALVKRLGADAD